MAGWSTGVSASSRVWLQTVSATSANSTRIVHLCGSGARHLARDCPKWQARVISANWMNGIILVGAFAQTWANTPGASVRFIKSLFDPNSLYWRLSCRPQPDELHLRQLSGGNFFMTTYLAGLLLVATTLVAQAPGSPAVELHDILDQYCFDCHNKSTRSGGLALDTLDTARLAQRAETWEKVVRKLRAGMMPPKGYPRPEPAAYEAFIESLETELDRSVPRKLPAPGLHRLNRAEYTNVIRDLLGPGVDATKFLPSDDSTHGFDNQAGTLTVSPALIEAYRSAAGKISRLAIGTVSTPAQTVYRVPEDTSQDYHIEGLPFGTRGGMVVKHVFPADAEYEIKVWPVNLGNMDNNQAFGSVSGEKLEVLLDGERIHVYDWDRELRQGNAIHGGTPPFRFAVKAGEHTIGVTFLATNYAP